MNRRPRPDSRAHHHPFAYYGRRRRSTGRALRRLALPITASVLFATVAIPLLSLGLVGDADIRRGSGQSDDPIQLVELPELPGRPSARESEIRSLKEWLRNHFDETEIEEMRETFVGGRDPDQVRAEVEKLADEVSRGVYVNVPRVFADRVNERIGRTRTKDLKGHFERIGPSPIDLEGLAIEEIFPEGK